MDAHGHTCASAMMGADSVELCAPLAQLKREHGPLREQMNEFARMAAPIGQDDSTTDWSEPLAELRTKVQAFAEQLDPHSGIEEGVLFPLMAKYIGRETGPIAVMEYEHDQAKANLGRFLEGTKAETAPVPAARAAELAGYAIAAQTILTDHFMKEENILFPMAEKLLTPEDKNQLAGHTGTSA
ncbi:hemerythrin domain-containing protein [Gorillibacterium sp. sgz5001074]|uniref:hemerythrin domain-containing protein n=1 Tax=Gorillibacterium sp. sgz5001074 TaxID=3446695 RepID=UPI003F667073